MDYILLPDGVNEDRTARVSVLAWHSKDGEVRNLLTHIRHRRADGMGPWAERPDHLWRTAELPVSEAVEAGEIQIHRIDCSLSYCRELVEGILDKSTITIGNIGVHYALEQPPRVHWAYRIHMNPSYYPDEHSVISPFNRHSAKVTEFWSFEPEPRDYWRRVCESYTPRQFQDALSSLAFRLDQRLDRVGNLMISGAEDEVDCELENNRSHLMLSVTPGDGTDLPENSYCATVWAGDSDDNLVQQHLEITERHTVVDVDSKLDQIGFALYRHRDGQCIDRLESPLTRGISINMNISGGQTLVLHDPRRGTTNTVSVGGARSVISVGGENSPALDSAIRRETLARKSWQRDRIARSQRNLGRFGPDQMEQAIDFFLNLLAHSGHSDGPIYFAEPYFMQRNFDDTNERMYSSMFATTQGQQLEILCGQRNTHTWLSKYPAILTNHVAIRSFTSKDGQGEDRPAFHDRYLVMPDKEIIITHSINGWHDQGVTFATLPYGVYRAEAEELWSLNLGQNSNGVYVQEVKK